MFRIFVLVFGLLLLPQAAWAEVKVVATIPNLAALARVVGGKHVSVSSMSLPTQDPHFVDAKPSLALELNRAQLLIVAGLQLESGWLPVLQQGARNPDILTGGKGFLDCSSIAVLKEVSGGPVDRSQGDIHPGGNPHYLADPLNAVRCASAIAERLAALDSEHAAAYRAAATDFAKSIDAKLTEWRNIMAPLAGTPTVVYHRSWVYLLDWLKFREVGALEPKPGIPPNPSHVAGLMGTIKREKARFILQESFYPDATSHLLADKTGIALVEVPGGPAANGSYVDWMDGLLEKIRTANKP